MTKENGTVISEIYDLLNPSAYIKQDGDDFILSLPSANSNLSEVRFRSFNPIVSRDILNSDRLTSEVRIEPVICAVDGELNVSTAYLPDHVINNQKGNLRLPIKGATYTVEFNGDLDALIKDVNDAIAGYCEDFDWDGTFSFCRPDGSDSHTLKVPKLRTSELTPYSTQYTHIAQIRADKGAKSYKGTRFLYQKDAALYIGTPASQQVVENVAVKGTLLYSDELNESTPKKAFHFVTTSGIYYHDIDTPSRPLLEGTVISYASKADAEGISIMNDKRATRHSKAQNVHLTLPFTPSAVMYIKNQYVMVSSDLKIYSSNDDGETWTLRGQSLSRIADYAVTFEDLIVFISRQHIEVFTSTFEKLKVIDNVAVDASVISEFLIFTDDSKIYEIPYNTLTPVQILTYGQAASLMMTSVNISTPTNYWSLELVQEDGTIREYYDLLVKTSNVLTPTATFSSLNHDLTVMNLCFNLSEYVLMFVIDVIINPLDLINMSSFYQVFNATANLKTSFVIYNNNCITVSKNFDKNLMRASYLYGGKTLTLACNQATNKSKKIYTDSENGRVYFKYFKASGSVPALVVYMLDKDNRKISLDYLSAIYDQIIVEIDYIYN